MKNPFQRNDHTLLIAGIAVGTAAAGAAAYLYFSEKGAQLRDRLTEQIGNLFRRRQQAFAAHETPDYMQHKMAKPKTDREKLQKGEILHQSHQGNEHDGGEPNNHYE